MPYDLVFGHTSGRHPEKLYNEKKLLTRYIHDVNARKSYYYKVERERTKDQEEKAKIRFDTNVPETWYTIK